MRARGAIRECVEMSAFLVVLLCVLPLAVFAGQDGNSNTYPFGNNPNENRRMYFPDAVSVLRNLDKFSSLHIRFHNCAWSPNSMPSFDDDGEYYDGEDAWYQGRTGAGSAANAGFSLYGTLKNRIQLGGCRRATYINSFFTDNGADVLVQALELNVDTSNTYCHEYEWISDDDGDGEGDNHGSGDNKNNNNVPQSATLGCTAEGRFATALFTDQYCQGAYFWNTTTDDETYSSYNRKLKGLHCHKIWNGRLSETTNGYPSVAHEILRQSQVCDTRANALCPNPWGRKSKDEKRLKLASAGSRTTWEYRVRRPLVRICHVMLATGLVLSLVAYHARNKERLKNQGWIACVSKDLPRWFSRRTKAVRRALFRKSARRRRSMSTRRRKSRSRDDEDEEYDDIDEGGGCGHIVMDDSHDVMDRRSPSYEMT